MTNLEIIQQEMILRNISIPCHTYLGWKERGYQVQRGQKALFSLKLWKPVKAKEVKEDAEKNSKMILVKAYMFSLEQVKPIEGDTEC